MGQKTGQPSDHQQVRRPLARQIQAAGHQGQGQGQIGFVTADVPSLVQHRRQIGRQVGGTQQRRCARVSFGPVG